MILQILGWIFTIWLLGNLIYSTKFHLGNYLLQRKRIKDKEVGEVYEDLHRQINRGGGVDNYTVGQVGNSNFYIILIT